jgi:hypothetical protein
MQCQPHTVLRLLHLQGMTTNDLRPLEQPGGGRLAYQQGRGLQLACKQEQCQTA